MLHTVLALLALAVSCFSQQSSAFVLGAPERQESRSAAALSGLRNRRVQVQRAGRPARPATVLQQVSGEPTDDPGAVSAAMSVKAGGAVAEKMSSQVVLRGRIFLIFVSFLFGTLNVALKALYAMPGAPQASALSFARGVLAAACFTPVLFTKAQQEADGAERPKNYGRAMTMAALELAFWNFGAQGLLNVGLLYADAGRASFLTQTSVVITPLLSLAAGYSVNRSLWVGCGAALSGLVLLSSGGAGAGAAAAGGAAATGIAGVLKGLVSMVSFSLGDVLVLGGALSWSMYIFRLSTVGDRYPDLPFQALKTLLLAGLYGTWFGSAAISAYMSGGMSGIAALWPGWKSWSAWGILFFSAIGPGALADVLQQKGQTKVSATEANVILCAEPVFTAVCARVLLGELTSTRDKMGGGLIVLAALIASGVFDRSKGNKDA